MFDLMNRNSITGAGLGRVLFLLFLCLSIVLVESSEANQPTVLKTSLSNGTTLLTLEDHSSPLVAVYMIYHVGSRDECAGLTGLSKICEKLMFEGTPTFPKGEFARIIQSGGGTISSESGLDIVGFMSKGVSTLLDTILLLEADRMQNVDPTYEKLVLVREAVKKERLTEVEGTLYGPINEEIFNLVFRAHPYQHPMYGWPSDLNNITLDDLKTFFRQYFQPANTTIVIVGDFTTEPVIRKVKDLFDKIPPLPLPEKRRIVEPEQRGERREILESSSEIPVALIGYHVPKAGSADMAALKIIRRILVGGESARLERQMVFEDKSAVRMGEKFTTCWTPD